MSKRTPTSPSKSIKCGACEKPVKERAQALMCELCLHWHHAGCQKISADLYKSIQAGGDNLHWFCPACNPKALDTIKLVQTIREKNDKLEKKIDSVESVVEEIKTALTKLTEDHQSHQEEMAKEIAKLRDEADSSKKAWGAQETIANAPAKPKDTQDVLHKVNDQLNRKKNVVIFGLAEKDTNLRDEIRAQDMNTVNEIVKLVADETPKLTTTRLGKRPETTEAKDPAKRPILVRFESEAEKDGFMRQLYKLKGSNFTHISVKQDMTREERETEKKLKEEAKNLNESNTDPQIIYLVRGQTWDRRVVKMKKRDN